MEVLYTTKKVFPLQINRLDKHRSPPYRAIAFEISPIKYSFSVASSEANEDHLLIFKHEKTEKLRVFKSTRG